MLKFLPQRKKEKKCATRKEIHTDGERERKKSEEVKLEVSKELQQTLTQANKTTTTKISETNK